MVVKKSHTGVAHNISSSPSPDFAFGGRFLLDGCARFTYFFLSLIVSKIDEGIFCLQVALYLQSCHPIYIHFYFIDGSRADSGRPLFVIFFFQKIFFQGRPESGRVEKTRPDSKKSRPESGRVEFFLVFFFWVFFFCFVFFWFFFFFWKRFYCGGDPSRADSG